LVLLGTIVNSVSILAGSILGLFLSGIPERLKATVLHGIGLAVFIIGASMGMKAGEDILLVIISVLLGGFLGEWMDIQGKLEAIGKYTEKKLKRYGKGKIAEAFVFSSLVYVIGAMAIVGAMESGLTLKHTTLYTKAMIDGISSIIFSSTLGIGVAMSAIPVFLYQGSIALCAEWLRSVLQDSVINTMTATGGILIMGISLQILEVKKIHVANLLPSIFIAALLKWLQIRLFN
jgi:uncharacterized membrane protein YqgA involved in biofilm formation